MVIKTDTRVFDISLRTLKNDSLSPDFFDDVETCIPQICKMDDMAYLMDETEADNFILWWDTEVYSANNVDGYEGDALSHEDGTYYILNVS